jgi:hypothetical protein
MLPPNELRIDAAEGSGPIAAAPIPAPSHLLPKILRNTSCPFWGHRTRAQRVVGAAGGGGHTHALLGVLLGSFHLECKKLIALIKVYNQNITTNY